MKYIFYVITIILILAGLFFILAGFSGKNGNAFDGVVVGFECMVAAAVIYGFSVIVRAATLYIEKAEE